MDRPSPPVFLLIAVLLCTAACVRKPAPEPLRPLAVVGELEVPECAVVDPDTGFVYVSNIEAVPAEYWSDNGKGFISRLTPQGSMDVLRWVDSSPDFIIHSPKGMCILNGVLYVADNSRVLGIRLADGTPERVIPVPGAERLNDMATDGRDVYVTEIAAGTILMLDLSGGDRHRVVAELESVNGITFDGGRMYGVSWDLHDLYEVDRRGLTPPRPFGLAEHFVNLDGIEVLDDGRFIVSDYVGGRVCLVSKDRREVTTLAELETPADFGLDRKGRRLFVPQLSVDRLTIYQLP